MSQGSAPCMALLSCDTLQAANALAPTQLLQLKAKVAEMIELKSQEVSAQKMVPHHPGVNNWVSLKNIGKIR